MKPLKYDEFRMTPDICQHSYILKWSKRKLIQFAAGKIRINKLKLIRTVTIHGIELCCKDICISCTKEYGFKIKTKINFITKKPFCPICKNYP